VQADLRGVDTHGSNRIPSYMALVRQGVLDPKVTPDLKKTTPIVAQVSAQYTFDMNSILMILKVDGHNGFGFLAANKVMACAIEMVKEFGIGMVSIKHSNYFGMSAWVVQQALDARMMSLVFTNSSPALPVWSGKSKLMGVSPIACGAPGGESPPFILLLPEARSIKPNEEARRFRLTGPLMAKESQQTTPRWLWKESCFRW
jgi:LDH2 family malate/lactate/ureidoglycolate dehydrogenase